MQSLFASCHTPCRWLVSLPAGVLVSVAGCTGVCQLSPGGCLVVIGPPGSVGPLLGGGVPLGPGSLGPWLELFQCSWLPAGPVGSLLQLPGASGLWLLGGSPGALLALL
ncbi:hypothetical protein AMECASPLE_038641 [Ameca splendens]|uniref:Uncharacterized protein n=1 Tax=Ameca splendens TaxID=208324 RepID=A0ABV0XLC0_9TELE